jgi:hypothetical protein
VIVTADGAVSALAPPIRCPNQGLAQRGGHMVDDTLVNSALAYRNSHLRLVNHKHNHRACGIRELQALSNELHLPFLLLSIPLLLCRETATIL